MTTIERSLIIATVEIRTIVRSSLILASTL